METYQIPKTASSSRLAPPSMCYNFCVPLTKKAHAPFGSRHRLSNLFSSIAFHHARRAPWSFGPASSPTLETEAAIASARRPPMSADVAGGRVACPGPFSRIPAAGLVDCGWPVSRDPKSENPNGVNVNGPAQKGSKQTQVKASSTTTETVDLSTSHPIKNPRRLFVNSYGVRILAATTFYFTSTLASPDPSSPPTDDIEKWEVADPAPKILPRGKYFNEPGGGDILGHYDVRYFPGEAVSYEKRADTLHHLIRAYLTTFREKNIETWIAHGTLLGWWWNGKILPWDWDLDVQVSSPTLVWLGENLNMTIHNYTSVAPEENGVVVETVHQYLLDINPHSVQRTRGDGLNIIDARFIDISTGLFIDITGLAETNPSGAPGIWSCKNYHRYQTKDLYPLRETIFEGVPALVPYAFDKILTQEYGTRALTKTLHEGHRWIPEQKEWVKEEGQMPLNPRATNPTKRAEPLPHVPRSLLADEEPSSGLGNLVRLFWR
ncbi:hypothetical protein B7463_g2951, partial [Scytalidium lignicola]